MFKSVSLPWLPAIELLGNITCDTFTDTRTQPFIVKDTYRFQSKQLPNLKFNLSLFQTRSLLAIYFLSGHKFLKNMGSRKVYF